MTGRPGGELVASVLALLALVAVVLPPELLRPATWRRWWRLRPRRRWCPLCEQVTEPLTPAGAVEHVARCRRGGAR